MDLRFGIKMISKISLQKIEWHTHRKINKFFIDYLITFHNTERESLLIHIILLPSNYMIHIDVYFIHDAETKENRNS